MFETVDLTACNQRPESRLCANMSVHGENVILKGICSLLVVNLQISWHSY